MEYTIFAITFLYWFASDDWSRIFPVWDLQRSLEELQFTYLTNTLFSLYVSPDDKNSQVWAIQVCKGVTVGHASMCKKEVLWDCEWKLKEIDLHDRLKNASILTS